MVIKTKEAKKKRRIKLRSKKNQLLFCIFQSLDCIQNQLLESNKIQNKKNIAPKLDIKKFSFVWTSKKLFSLEFEWKDEKYEDHCYMDVKGDLWSCIDLLECLRNVEVKPGVNISEQDL